MTRRLTLEHAVVPSMNAVADAAGVSKGGLFHHFPSRAALVDGLAQDALRDIDSAMEAAAAEGGAALAWLRLSVPSGEELDLFTAMAVAHRALEAPGAATIAAASQATRRWEQLIADEVGDPVLARIIRLVGDGLAMNALIGLSEIIEPSAVDDLARRLIPSGHRQP